MTADPVKAEYWLKQVLETTSESEAGDAYVRAKALQKLGVLTWRKGGKEAREEARKQFRASIHLCQVLD